ncbi:MAG: carboxypeptidase-like regulatory domain-containing protein [Gemmatimonadaceae bacterium]
MSSRSLIVASALSLLAFALPKPARAQIDVIRGHVTNADGKPLVGVRITATSIPGNVTREGRSDGRGSFQIAFPGGQGDYMMGYALVGYNFRQFEIKRTADQDVLVADARLGPVLIDTVNIIAPVQQRVGRNSTTQDVSGTERSVPTSSLPVDLLGNISAMAASLPGVLLIPGVDGAADGFSVLGLGADQNSVTLNGLQSGAGGLPRDANISGSLSTSPYDASRGGFSGGQFNIRSGGGGSNYKSRGMSLVANTPQLQWTDPAARALGNEFSNLSFGGSASGPIKPNKAFYNASYQIGRNSRVNHTLLNATPLSLQTAGVSADSVYRFLDILSRSGVPTSTPFDPASRHNDNGSFLVSVDITPPNSVSGSSYGFTANGNFGHQNPSSGGITQLASASGERTDLSGGLQVRQNRYIGLLLSETSAGINASRNYGDPYLDLPSGTVRVNSILADGASGVQSLGFGGNQNLNSRSQSISGTVQNTLSWFDDANKHRIKLFSQMDFSGNSQNQSNNLRGSYYFNSLEDLDARRPASFNRTLSARQRSTGLYSGALALTDSYRRSQDLQIQYGVRLETSHFTATPKYNPDVEAAFGKRNDHVPSPVSISPRIGFSYTTGTAQEISAFQGAVRGPRAVIRGGIGLFANGSNAGSLSSVLDNTGLPSGAQQLVCVGEAAPIPDWRAYEANPIGIPDKCADGSAGTVFSNSTPNVALIGAGYRPQQSIRSNLSWSGAILDARFSTNAELTYAYNLNQQRSVDINFNPTQRFSLLAEDGRPIFVNPTSIVEETGAIALADARISPLFSRVTEYRSDLSSQTAQLQLRIQPIYRTPTKFNWSAAYTFTGIREQVSGFSSTAGNPLNVFWAKNQQGPHQLSYSLRYNFFNYVTVNWSGQFRSGAAFTPTIVGDINGDGYSNDRAFVYNPTTTADTALASGMRQLLANSSGAAQSCLNKQLGHIAARNSCLGPWSSTASLNITLDRIRFRLPNRASLNFSLSNPLGAADLALNGSGKLKGWGQTASPDQALLYVRGFDAAEQHYKYEVNQRFGATRPQFLTLRSPVSLTVSLRYDLGPTRERQNFEQQLGYAKRETDRRNTEANFRSIGSSGVPNPMSSILRQQDSLHLTAVQADSIASMNRRYNYRADSLWTPAARRFASLPEGYRDNVEYGRYLEARHAQINFMLDIVIALRKLLTHAQIRKLPSSVTTYLDPRYLQSIRNGNGLFVGGGNGG